MATRFDGKWSCFIVQFDDEENGYAHRLTSIGTMYLEFKTNGELKHGVLVYDGDEVQLTGSCTRVGELRINLESQEYDGFEGILTFENDDRTREAVTGKLHLPDDSRFKKRLLEAGILSKRNQDDPPWVITKP